MKTPKKRNEETQMANNYIIPAAERICKRYSGGFPPYRSIYKQKDIHFWRDRRRNGIFIYCANVESHGG